MAITKDEPTVLEREASKEKRERIYESEYPQTRRALPYSRLFWSAIIAGFVMVTITQLMFSLLGLGIGLSTVDPLVENDPLAGIGAGSIIWWSVSMLISLFFGGWITGKLAQNLDKRDANIHGLLTWSVFSLVSFFVLSTTIGNTLSGAGNILGRTISLNEMAATSRDGKVDISDLKRQARNLFSESSILGGSENEGDRNEDMRDRGSSDRGTQNKATSDRETKGKATSDREVQDKGRSSQGVQNRSARDQQSGLVMNPKKVEDEVENYFNNQTPENKRVLVNAVMDEADLSRDEANREVEKWISQYDQSEIAMKEKAEKVTEAVSSTALIGFFALIIGAFVTVWGTRTAVPERIVEIR